MAPFFPCGNESLQCFSGLRGWIGTASEWVDGSPYILKVQSAVGLQFRSASIGKIRRSADLTTIAVTF